MGDKIIFVRLSALSLFHVGRVVQNRRNVLRLLGTNGWQTSPKTIAPKSVPHVQHDYFSAFNQSYH